MEIVPLPPHQGMGFMSLEPIDEKIAKRYRYEPVVNGVVTYHNYHFTSTEFELPIHVPTVQARIDGFSPNLNKTLHIGHLRNLLVGAALHKITGTTEKPVAMLGACLGVTEGAMDRLQQWYKLAKYAPDIYIDVDLVPPDYDYKDFGDGVGEQAGCKVTHGPDPVIVRKSNGTSAYAMHDLLFAARVKPTHYVTGDEQVPHFKSIGLGDKHLPMGIVLGTDGKKLASRDGNGMQAEDALGMLRNAVGNIDDNSTIDLAWNVLAWNFLSVRRVANAKFDPKVWANPDRGGLYISYTYARVKSALKKAGHQEPVLFEPHPIYDAIDIPIMGHACYFDYYLKRAREEMDTVSIAQYAFDLAKRLGRTMEQRRVIGGTNSFHCALWRAMVTLERCMTLLTMNPLEVV